MLQCEDDAKGELAKNGILCFAFVEAPLGSKESHLHPNVSLHALGPIFYPTPTAAPCLGPEDAPQSSPNHGPLDPFLRNHNKGKERHLDFIEAAWGKGAVTFSLQKIKIEKKLAQATQCCLVEKQQQIHFLKLYPVPSCAR